MTALVRIDGLRIVARGEDGVEFPIVHDVSLSVAPGEVLALIGESGSGKTTIALSMLGYARAGCRIAAGAITVAGQRIDTLDEPALRALRGRTVAYVAQSAAAAFNPALPIMAQVIEPALIHGLMPRPGAEAKARALFAKLALPDPDRVGDRYPHQVSGGQLQRLMAAMALMTDPALVIFDEPTTALDVTTQVEVLQAFRRVFRQERATGIYVSHDLAVVAQMADHILVLNGGRVREQNRAAPLLAAPADDYTRMLMAAAHPVIAGARVIPASDPQPLLSIEGVSAGYGAANPVLSDVSIAIPRGGAVGVIGESGSGKSTVARVVAGLLAPSAGRIVLDGTPLAPDLAQRSRDELRRIQIVFQNADTALNPAHSVGDILGRVIRFYHGASGADARKRVQRLLDLTKLPAAAIDRRCDELSGGQKQRVNLARALAADPDVILCDEVTSALDTVVRGAILDLLAELRRELGLAYLFISHDIATVQALCDDIVVLYRGTRVESGTSASYATRPYHPYTDLLIASVPEMRADWLGDEGSRQAPPFAQLSESPELCRFLPRCPVAIAGRCDRDLPPLRTLSNGNRILCHRGEDELVR